MPGGDGVQALLALPRAVTVREPQPPRWRFDVRPGRSDPSSFPRSAWLRAARRAVTTASHDAFGIGEPQGQLALRVELSAYLSRARGLSSTPDQVIVTSGSTQGLGLVARSVAPGGGRVAVEEPSMPLHREIVRAAGHEVVPVEVDGRGMRVEELERMRRADLVVLTPNRQHPTGAALAPQRRSWLLSWARRAGSLVVEDDHDGEFRYDRHPISALQSLDPGVVICAGTLSKTLAPGVRLGWPMVTDPLRDAVVKQKALADWQSAALEQLTFAELLRSGAYDRHVRRMRLVYRSRRDAVIAALRAARPGLEILGDQAGLNLLAPLPSAEAESDALRWARRQGMVLGGLA